MCGFCGHTLKVSVFRIYWLFDPITSYFISFQENHKAKIFIKSINKKVFYYFFCMWLIKSLSLHSIIIFFFSQKFSSHFPNHTFLISPFHTFLLLLVLFIFFFLSITNNSSSNTLFPLPLKILFSFCIFPQ
jgi:hypothetical protein